MDESKLDESRVGRKQGWTKTGWTKTGWTKMNWTKSGSTCIYVAIHYNNWNHICSCNAIKLSQNFSTKPYEIKRVISRLRSIYIIHIQFWNKAFRHVSTLFVQGNQVHTDQNKPQKETNKTEQREKQTKDCFLSVWTWSPWMNKVSTRWNALFQTRQTYFDCLNKQKQTTNKIYWYNNSQYRKYK